MSTRTAGARAIRDAIKTLLEDAKKHGNVAALVAFETTASLQVSMRDGSTYLVSVEQMQEGVVADDLPVLGSKDG